VTATAPVVSSGGAAPVISMAANPTFSGTVTATTFVGSLSGNAATASTAANSNNLGGQPPSFYQPASTAITTTNIGSQTVATAGNANNLGGLTAASYQKIIVPMALDDLGVQFGSPTRVNVALGTLPSISSWLLPVGGSCVAGTTIVPIGFLGGAPSVTLTTTSGLTAGSYVVGTGAVTVKAGSSPANSLNSVPSATVTSAAASVLNSTSLLMISANLSASGVAAVAGDVVWFRVCNMAFSPNISFYLVGVQFTWN
jgi:hypothetical protein